MVAQELCEQGGGAGLPHRELDSLLLQLLSTAGSPDTATFFPTTVERADCKVHKLLCTGWLHATSAVALVVAVFPNSVGWRTWDEHYTGT